MPKVFVSYRRSDAREAAVRIADDLVDEFGLDSVFFDTETIDPGESFPSEIMTNIDHSTHVLVIIGPDWLIKDKNTGLPRIEDPEDWVRREIRTALSHPATVIPVLVENAQMPSPNELPLDLRSLCEQNAVELRPDRFKGSLNELIDRLRDQSALRAGVILLIACVLAAALGLTLQALFNMFFGLFESVQDLKRAITELADETGATVSEIDQLQALATNTGIHMSGSFGNSLQLALISFGGLFAALSYLPIARTKIPFSVLTGLCAYGVVHMMAFVAGYVGSDRQIYEALYSAAAVSSANLAAMAMGLLWPQMRSMKLDYFDLVRTGVCVFLASFITVVAVNYDFGNGVSSITWVQTFDRNAIACITASVYDPCDADAEAVHVLMFVGLTLMLSRLVIGARVSFPRTVACIAGWAVFCAALIVFRKAISTPEDFFTDAKFGTAVVCAVMAFTLARWNILRSPKRGGKPSTG